MTKSKIGPFMPYKHPVGPSRPTYVSIRVSTRLGILRTKVSLDTEPVDSHLGNAILEAIDASGVNPSGATVTVRFS